MTTQGSRIDLRYSRWFLALGIWAGITFSMQAEEKSDGGDGGTFVAGCSGCAGLGAGVAKFGGALKSCTVGSSAVKGGALLKFGAAAGTVKGGHASLQAAGRGFLRSADRASLLHDARLMSDIPELEEALRRGVPIERFIADHPDATTKIGMYVAKADRERFARLIADDIHSPSIVRPPLVDDVLRTKLGMERTAEGTVNDLAIAVRRHGSPISPEIVAQEASALSNVGANGDKVKVTVDGLFVEIRVEKDAYTFVAQIDIAALAASGGASAISISVAESDFYRTEPRMLADGPPTVTRQR